MYFPFMPANAKSPGDGKLRESIERALEEAERLASAYADAAESGDGVEEALFAYKKFFRKSVYDQVNYKAKNNSTIVMSRGAIESLERQTDKVTKSKPLVSAYPAVLKELDEYEPNLRSMLDVCKDRMVDANRIQTLKGQPKSGRPA